MPAPKSIADRAVYDPAIDGLRGLAILMVIWNHVAISATSDPRQVFDFLGFGELSRGSASGVSLFFVLSSLTLMRSTSFRFDRETSPRRNFYIRRAFRILPLWWAFIPLSAVIRHAPKGVILPHMLMTFGFIGTPNFTHVGWSLWVEETFYFFFPLMFVGLRRRRGAIAFFLFSLILSSRLPGFSLQTHMPAWSQLIFKLPFNHYVTFGLGIFCFHLATQARFQGIIPKTKIPPHVWDLIAVPLFVASLVTPPHSNFNIVADFLFVFTALQEKTWLRRAMQATFLRSFGICCYSIYLFHGLILFWFRYTPFFRMLSRPPLNPEWQTVIGFILGAAASYAVGRFSFRFFERPCVEAGQRLIAKWRSAGV